jgi:hypothetical protein
MPEIGSSGLMSGDGKRGLAIGHKLPRPSSTLPEPTSVRRAFAESHFSVDDVSERLWRSTIPKHDVRAGKNERDRHRYGLLDRCLNTEF